MKVKVKDLKVIYEDERLRKLDYLPISNTSIKKAKEIWKSKTIDYVVDSLTNYGLGATISESVYDHDYDDIETSKCIIWFIRRAGYRFEYEETYFLEDKNIYDKYTKKN